MSLNKPQFVYLVGPARSGTTITMFMLCDHPELVVWPQEFPFYTEYNSLLPKKTFEFDFDTLLRAVWPRLDEFKGDLSSNRFSMFDFSNVNYAKLMAAIEKRRKPLVAKEEFLRILLEAFQETVYPQNKNVKHYIVNTKCGGIEWHDRDFIRRSRFIFMVRDPLRCFASFRDAIISQAANGELDRWSYPKDFFYFIQKGLILSSRRLSKHHQDSNFYFVSLEQLKAKPKDVMTSLAEFLGIEYSDQLLTPTCVQRPFKGHFAEKGLNRSVIVNADSRHNALEPFEKYVIYTLLAGEWLKKYGMEKRPFFLLGFIVQLIHAIRNSEQFSSLKRVDKMRYWFYVLKSILKLRVRVALDAWLMQERV